MKKILTAIDSEIIIFVKQICCQVICVIYRLPFRRDWTDELRPNKHLQKAKKLFNNKINGPESIVADGGNIQVFKLQS